MDIVSDIKESRKHLDEVVKPLGLEDSEGCKERRRYWAGGNLKFD